MRVFRISQVFALLFAACAACASVAPNKRPQLDLRAEKIEIIAPNGSTEDEIFAAQLLRSELSNILFFPLFSFILILLYTSLSICIPAVGSMPVYPQKISDPSL